MVNIGENVFGKTGLRG